MSFHIVDTSSVYTDLFTCRSPLVCYTDLLFVPCRLFICLTMYQLFFPTIRHLVPSHHSNLFSIHPSSYNVSAKPPRIISFFMLGISSHFSQFKISPLISTYTKSSNVSIAIKRQCKTMNIYCLNFSLVSFNSCFLLFKSKISHSSHTCLSW